MCCYVWADHTKWASKKNWASVGVCVCMCGISCFDGHVGGLESLSPPFTITYCLLLSPFSACSTLSLPPLIVLTILSFSFLTFLLFFLLCLSSFLLLAVFTPGLLTCVCQCDKNSQAGVGRLTCYRHEQWCFLSDCSKMRCAAAFWVLCTGQTAHAGSPVSRTMQ